MKRISGALFGISFMSLMWLVWNHFPEHSYATAPFVFGLILGVVSEGLIFIMENFE